MNSTSTEGAAPAAELKLARYQLIADVELDLLAELDRRMISAEELIRLKEGDVITFGRPAGENISLFAGDVLLGSAEILVVDERLAVRVADLRDKLARSK